MRSSDRRRRDLAAIAAVGLAAGLLVAVPGAVLGAVPSPTPGIGDPRSSGQGPGLVGDPLTAVLVVVAIAVVTVGITLAYVRMTAHRGDTGRS